MRSAAEQQEQQQQRKWPLYGAFLYSLWKAGHVEQRCRKKWPLLLLFVYTMHTSAVETHTISITILDEDFSATHFFFVTQFFFVPLLVCST